MDDRFGRKPATRPSLYPSFGGTFDVEGYIHYHGAALVRRFDANSHLYLTRAMDLYDLYRDGGERSGSTASMLPCSCLASAATGSIPPRTCAICATSVAAAGKDVDYHELDSPDGHDAFLKEWDMLTESIGPFIAASPRREIERSLPSHAVAVRAEFIQANSESVRSDVDAQLDRRRQAMSETQPGFETQALHAGQEIDPTTKVRAVPIYHDDVVRVSIAPSMRPICSGSKNSGISTPAS